MTPTTYTYAPGRGAGLPCPDWHHHARHATTHLGATRWRLLLAILRGRCPWCSGSLRYGA